MDRENHLHLFSGGSRGKPDLCPPSSLAIDFGTLQRRNKREILGNMHIRLHWTPTEYLDPPMHVFSSILHLQRLLLILYIFEYHEGSIIV